MPTGIADSINVSIIIVIIIKTFMYLFFQKCSQYRGRHFHAMLYFIILVI